MTRTFSLAEYCAIDPVLSLWAGDPARSGLFAEGKHLFNSQITARILAVTVSIFAVVDMSSHLVLGTCKAVYVICRGDADVARHFKQAGNSFIILVIGSVAGVVWPGLFVYLPHSPVEASVEKPAQPQKQAEKKAAPAQPTRAEIKAAAQRRAVEEANRIFGLTSKKQEESKPSGEAGVEDEQELKQAAAGSQPPAEFPPRSPEKYTTIKLDQLRKDLISGDSSQEAEGESNVDGGLTVMELQEPDANSKRLGELLKLDSYQNASLHEKRLANELLRLSFGDFESFDKFLQELKVYRGTLSQTDKAKFDALFQNEIFGDVLWEKEFHH